MVRLIRSLDDLRKLAVRDTKRRIRQVVLELPGLPADEAIRWQSKLNRQMAACGCGEGAAALMLSFSAIALWVGLTLFQGGELAAWKVVLALAAGVAAGCLGKAVGLASARRRFLRVVGDLDSAVSRQFRNDTADAEVHP